MSLLFLQRSAPDITNLLLYLLAFFLLMLGIDISVRWLKTKPWKKNKIINNMHIGDTSLENKDQIIDNKEEDSNIL